MSEFFDRDASTLPPLEGPIPGRMDTFTGRVSLQFQKNDSWDFQNSLREQMRDEMFEALVGRAPGARGPQDPDSFNLGGQQVPATNKPIERMTMARNMDGVFAQIADLRQFYPERFGTMPASEDEFERELNRRITREIEENETYLARSPYNAIGMLGDLAGAATDEYSLATMAVGGPAGAGLKGAAVFLAREFAIGATSEIPSVIKSRDIAERMGREPENPALQIAMGGAGNAILGGAVEYGWRGVKYMLARDGIEAANGVTGLHRGQAADAAEEAVRTGRDIRIDPLRPNPTLRAEDDPAVENLLKFIGVREASAGANQVSGYALIAPPRDLTTMSVDEVLAWQDANIRAGAKSTAAGQFQVIRKTLQGAKDQMGLSGGEAFDEAMQMRIAVHLMKGRGLEAWRAGKMSDEEFGNLLAQEWAALPRTTGPGRGSSHYAGDGLNAAGASAEDFLAAIGGRYAEDLPPTAPLRVRGAAPRAPRDVQERFSEVVTPAGTPIRVQTRVVDLMDLIHASGDLQPRDRTRLGSDEQIAEISGRLDPARLMPGPETDRGAPLIGQDMVIESGNGRVAALRRAVSENPDGWRAYEEMVRERYEVPDGVRHPVVVQERIDPVSQQERIRTVRESNTSSIARMGAAEQAKFDADWLGQPVFDAYRPGRRLNGPENREFVRRFLGTMTGAERKAMQTARGALSPAGKRRLEDALFARAFDADDLIALATETEDRAVEGLVRMLTDVAPDWAAFRAMVEAGFVRPEFDITDQLMQASRIVARARLDDLDGQSVVAAIRDALAQKDMFAEADPLVEDLIGVFYRTADGKASPRSPSASSDILRRYAAEAMQIGRADTGSLIDDAVTPRDVLRRAIEGYEARTPYSTPEPAEPEAADVPRLDAVDTSRLADGAMSPEAMRANDELEGRLREADNVGPFGPVLTQFKGDWRGAVAELQRRQSGEAIGALTHPEIGDISLVWGEPGKGRGHGFGLAKIIDRHPEVLDDLQGRLDRATTVISRSENRIRLASETDDFSIRLTWEGEQKSWLLTAYERDADEIMQRGAGRSTGKTGSSPEGSSPSAPLHAEHSASRADFQADGTDAALDEARAAWAGQEKTTYNLTGDEDGPAMTVGDVLADLEDDRALLRGMTSCMLKGVPL